GGRCAREPNLGDGQRLVGQRVRVRRAAPGARVHVGQQVAVAIVGVVLGDVLVVGRVLGQHRLRDAIQRVVGEAGGVLVGGVAGGAGDRGRVARVADLQQVADRV